jgi:hypothetical protein
VAPKKGGFDSLKAAVGGLSSRLPFPKRTPAAPEPFSAIEDDTPLGDLLSAENAAPGPVEKKEGRERTDFKALASSVFGSAVKSTPGLIAIVVALVFILALIIKGIIVASPPKPLPAAAPLTQKGEALVRTWLLPPGDPLEPKMAMEREGTARYTVEDAARLGKDPDPRLFSSLRAKNDEAIDDLFGTVP